MLGNISHVEHAQDMVDDFVKKIRKIPLLVLLISKKGDGVDMMTTVGFPRLSIHEHMVWMNIHPSSDIVHIKCPEFNKTITFGISTIPSLKSVCPRFDMALYYGATYFIAKKYDPVEFEIYSAVTKKYKGGSWYPCYYDTCQEKVGIEILI